MCRAVRYRCQAESEVRFLTGLESCFGQGSFVRDAAARRADVAAELSAELSKTAFQVTVVQRAEANRCLL